MAKLVGTVKTIKREEGYGFISRVNEEDHFFHRKSLEMTGPGWEEIDIGMVVEFTSIMQPGKGVRAIEVRVMPNGQ